MDVTVPRLPTNMDSAEVTAVYVSEGDVVSKHTRLLTLKHGDTTTDVTSAKAGIVSGFTMWHEQIVTSGQVLFSLVDSMNVLVPLLPNHTDSATVAMSYVNDGDIVPKDKVLLEIETHKMALDVIAPATGKVSGFSLTHGQEVTSEQVLFSIVACDENGTLYDVPTEEDAPIELPRFFLFPFWLNVTITILAVLTLICFFVWLIRLIFFTGF